MDMKKNSKIPECGPVPDISTQKVVVGMKQLKKAVASRRAAYVYLAKNADPVILDPLEDLCRQQNIHITWVPTMAELGSACGIEVGAAAAAVVE